MQKMNRSTYRLGLTTASELKTERKRRGGEEGGVCVCTQSPENTACVSTSVVITLAV